MENYDLERLRVRVVSSLFAAVYQGSKLNELYRASSKQDQTGTLLDPLGIFFKRMPWNHASRAALKRAEEYFFLLSLRDLYRWIDVAEKYLAIPSDVFAPIKPFKAVITDARDMREHEDDYVLPNRKPRHPQRYKVTADFTGVGYRKIIADARWTISVNGKIMIANRVDFHETFEQCIAVTMRLREIEDFKDFFKDEPICSAPDMQWPELAGYLENFEGKGF